MAGQLLLTDNFRRSH